MHSHYVACLSNGRNPGHPVMTPFAHPPLEISACQVVRNRLHTRGEGAVPTPEDVFMAITAIDVKLFQNELLVFLTGLAIRFPNGFKGVSPRTLYHTKVSFSVTSNMAHVILRIPFAYI